MVSFPRKLPDDVEGDLQEQIARLGAELSGLKQILARRSASAFAEARDQTASAYGGARDVAADVYSDLWERFTDSLPGMRKRALSMERAAEKVAGRAARSVEQAARENPAVATAVVGLVVVGLLVTMLASRSAPEPEQRPSRRSKR